MNAGNPRSPSCYVLRVSCLRALSGVGVAILAALFFSAQLAHSQEERPSGALDRAEVEPFHYEDPPDDLQLDEAGENKRDALLLFYRGISLEESDMPAALKFFKQVIELDPSNVALAMETATHCAVYGRFSEAHSILEESLEQNQDNRDAYLNLSRYCDAHHNNDEELKSHALEYAEMAVEKFPSDHIVIEHFAKLLLERGENKRAEELLEEAIKREVKDGEYWLAMGGIARDVWPMRNEKNRERVVNVYEMALKSDPHNLDTAEQVARFHRAAGNTVRALQIFLEVVKLSPDRLSAREELAELYWEAGSYPEAVAGMESLVQINPENVEVRRKLSDMYIALKDLARAIGHSEAIVESGTAGVDDFIKLAELQRFADRIGGALQTLRQGAAVYPDSPHLSSTLGRVYLNLDRYDNAYAAFKMAETQAETGEPSFLDEGFYFEYAMSAERAGNFDQAEALFRKSIELVPEDAQEEKAKSLNYLGYMWLEKEKNVDEAGEMIHQANELKPDNGAYLDSLGWFYYLKGDFDEAIKHLLRAAELMEEEPDSVIFEHLSRSYLADGDKDKARSYLKRALELEPEKEELKALKKSIDESAESEDEESDKDPAP